MFDADLTRQCFCHSIPNCHRYRCSSKAKCLPVLRVYRWEGPTSPHSSDVLGSSSRVHSPSVSLQHLAVRPIFSFHKPGLLSNQQHRLTFAFSPEFQAPLRFRLQMWKPLRSVTMTELPGHLHRGSGGASNGPGAQPRFALACFVMRPTLEPGTSWNCQCFWSSSEMAPEKDWQWAERPFLLVPPPFLSLGLMFVFLACDSPAELEADAISHTEQQQCEFHPKKPK